MVADTPVPHGFGAALGSVDTFFQGLQNSSLPPRSRVVKKLERIEIAQLRILHRLPFRIGLLQPRNSAYNLAFHEVMDYQGNLRCYGRTCSPMSPERSIKNSCCETNICRRRTGS